METQSINALMHWRKWQQTEGGTRLFPTIHSLAWFIRRNEKQLVASGGLIKMRNQWHLIQPAFECALIEILRIKTLQTLEQKQ